jgi:hypothetical protein
MNIRCTDIINLPNIYFFFFFFFFSFFCNLVALIPGQSWPIKRLE